MTRDPLGDEVRRALRDRADALDVADAPFDRAGAEGLDTVDLGDAGPRRRRPVSSRVALAAAALVVAVGVGAVVGTRIDDPSERTGTDDPAVADPTGPTGTTEPRGPIAADTGPGLLPAPPEDMEAWALRWGPEVAEQPALAQLFEGRGSGARILVVIHPDAESGPSTSRTVRGRPAVTYPSAVDPETSTALSWEEDGAVVTADYAGMEEAGAVAFLDGLERRTAVPAGGYAAPTAGPLALADEVEGGAVTVRVTEVAYRDRVGSAGTGVGEQLTVRAGVPEAPTIDALWDRYRGTVDETGRTTRVDEDDGVLRWTEPDGSWVEVDSEGTVDDADDLAAVAATVDEVDAAALVALRAEIEDRIATEVPVVAQVGLESSGRAPGATIEQRAVAGVEAVCLEVSGHPRRCSGAGVDPTDQGSFLIDGRWYVVGIGRSPVPVTAEPASATGPAPPPVPGLRRGSTSDGWDASLVEPPPEVDVVYVGGQIQGGVVTRPGV